MGARNPIWNTETGKLDFSVAGRSPGANVNYWIDRYGQEQIIANDLHDMAFIRLAQLFTCIRGGHPLRIQGKDYPVWPLQNCLAPRCGRFFFQPQKDKATCSKPCQNRLNYQFRKSRREVERDGLFVTVQALPRKSKTKRLKK